MPPPRSFANERWQNARLSSSGFLNLIPAWRWKRESSSFRSASISGASDSLFLKKRLGRRRIKRERASAAGERVQYSRRVSLLLLRLDELERVADRLEFVRLLIRHLDAELFLDRIDKLERIKAVCAKILTERRIERDLALVDLELFGDELLHLVKQFVCHRTPLRIYSSSSGSK